MLLDENPLIELTDVDATNLVRLLRASAKKAVIDFEEQLLDFDNNYISDFDPVKEWLLDPDPCLMPDSEPQQQQQHKDLILEPSIDAKMETVSLLDPKLEPNIEEETLVAAEKDLGTGDAGVGDISLVNDDPIMAENEIYHVKESSKEEPQEESSEEDSSSEDSSSSSPAASSSSSDEEVESLCRDKEEEGEMEKKVAFEEGEIQVDELDQFVFGSDGEEDTPKGPIKSKHEVEDLPPVPPLEVSLEPHHQTLPVGFVSSILDNRVIVEGSEKHSPLNEGSILWITESRLPLGRIDEIFGPVKNPYYIVRYNSDKEVPQGINIGVPISFVVDFANHILNDKTLFEKGYDASGVDDEDATEVEFSDDEKEKEYRNSLRQKKRDTSRGNQATGFDKKKNFKGARFCKDKQSNLPHLSPVDQPPASQQCPVQASQGMVNFGNNTHSMTTVPPFPSQPQAFQMGDAFGGTFASAQAFLPQMPNIQGGFTHQPSPLGMQGGFTSQPQSMVMQGGLPSQPQFMTSQGLPMNWLSAQLTSHLPQQNQVLNNFAMGIMPFQQQLVPNVGAHPGNMPWFPGPVNPSMLDPSSALAALMGQGVFGQGPFGCNNMEPQVLLAQSNAQSHGQTPVSGSQHETLSPTMPLNNERSFSRGRRPYQRGNRSFGCRGGGRHNS